MLLLIYFFWCTSLHRMLYNCNKLHKNAQGSVLKSPWPFCKTVPFGVSY